MELASRYISYIRGLRFPIRIPKLPSGSSARYLAIKRTAISLSLITVGLGLAKMAYHSGGQDFLRSWLFTHPPSALVWEAALSTRGYIPVENAAINHRLAASLPALSANPLELWTTQDQEWLVLYGQREDENPKFFGRPAALKVASQTKGTALPQGFKQEANWQKLGASWDAIDLIATLPLPHPETKIMAKTEDPKQIRY